MSGAAPKDVLTRLTTDLSSDLDALMMDDEHFNTVPDCSLNSVAVPADTDGCIRFSGVIDPWADALVTDEQVRGGGAAALQPTEGGTQAGDDQGLQVPSMGATHVWQN